MDDYGKSNRERVSVGGWILAIMLLFVPVVNIIPGVCYLCSKKKTMRNFVIAGIIWYAIFFTLIVGAFFLFKYALPDLYDKIFMKIFDLLGVTDKLPNFFVP